MESRFYPGVEVDAARLQAELRTLFDKDEAFQVQTMQVSSSAVLQARKSGTLRDLTGLSAALTIKVTPEQAAFYVELMKKVQATPEWKDYIEKTSQVDTFLTGSEFDKFIKQDI